MTDCISPATSRFSVVLHSTLFQQSVLRYLDATKPDALARKQIESWTLEWKEQENKNTPLEGSLTINGDFVVLTLQVLCNWTYENGIGSLDFSMHARAKCRTKNEVKKLTRIEQNRETKSSKIRAAIATRLNGDDYIKILLLNDNVLLCEAAILVDDKQKQLEEKVYINDDGMESFRRCIYSHAEDTLVVMEFLMSLDFLSTPDCPLGHRAKLRLLEEATLDACEKQGEEEILHDLAIDDVASDDQRPLQKVRITGTSSKGTKS
jgi:hypothetical protein